MANVIALEHPELCCRRLDLDPQDPGDPSEILFNEVTARGPEDQIAMRGGVRQAPRLARHDVSTGTDESRRPIRSDASYLITGGLQGLGLLVARWMVDRGATHIVLVGRGNPEDSASQIIRELVDRGAKITTIRADVTNAAEMARIIADIRVPPMPALRGVVHAAGVLDNGVLLNLTWERFQNVLSPKTVGAWNLHALTSDCALDFFVMFSSTASILGSSGQANHAAANAYLDALAHYRRAQNLPGLSINWGAWSEVGSAAKMGIDAQLDAKGIGMIPPRLGLDALERLVSSPAVQVAVMPVDWQAFVKSRAHSPFIGDLLNVPARAPDTTTSFL